VSDLAEAEGTTAWSGISLAFLFLSPSVSSFQFVSHDFSCNGEKRKKTDNYKCVNVTLFIRDTRSARSRSIQDAFFRFSRQQESAVNNIADILCRCSYEIVLSGK